MNATSYNRAYLVSCLAHFAQIPLRGTFEKLIMNSHIRPMNKLKEARLMLQLGGDVRGGRVLEIGCGRGVGVEIIFDIFSPSCVEAFDFDLLQ